LRSPRNWVYQKILIRYN